MMSEMMSKSTVSPRLWGAAFVLIQYTGAATGVCFAQAPPPVTRAEMPKPVAPSAAREPTRLDTVVAGVLMTFSRAADLRIRPRMTAATPLWRQWIGEPRWNDVLAALSRGRFSISTIGVEGLPLAAMMVLADTSAPDLDPVRHMLDERCGRAALAAANPGLQAGADVDVGGMQSQFRPGPDGPRMSTRGGLADISDAIESGLSALSLPTVKPSVFASPLPREVVASRDDSDNGEQSVARLLAPDIARLLAGAKSDVQPLSSARARGTR